MCLSHRPSLCLAVGLMSHRPSLCLAVGLMSHRPSLCLAVGLMSHRPSLCLAVGLMPHRPSLCLAVGLMSHRPSLCLAVGLMSHRPSLCLAVGLMYARFTHKLTVCTHLHYIHERWGYRLFSGSSSRASGNLMPRNRGLRLKISRCLAIRLPVEECKMSPVSHCQEKE